MRTVVALMTVGVMLAQDLPKDVPQSKAAAEAKAAAAAKDKAPKVPGIGRPKLSGDMAKIGKLKEKAIGVPAGSPLTVAVKGTDGKAEKIYGRMGAVNNDGFSMQTISGAGDLQERQLSFADVSSMKPGPKQSKLQQIRGPLLGAMSLMTLAGTVIAIVKK